MATKIKEYKCKPEEKGYTLAVSAADTIIGEQSLGMLLEDMQRGYIVDDISMQRDFGQWSKKDMSLLVHTVLIGLSIAPISLDQEGTGDGVVKRLTDGKQRMNAFEAYKNNEFPLYKFCPPVRIKRQKMEPVLDENGEPKMKGKKPVMEGVVDESGNPVIEEVVYSVAGKRFSQLPDDLQYRFLKYRKMKQIVHLNYTEEETKLQMIRDNTSVKMTPAQIGMVASGEDLAQWLRDLRSHPLFLDYSTWTQNQIKKSAQERCVVESSILAYSAENWNSSYATNNDAFIANDSDDARAAYVDMLDDLAKIVSKYPELWKALIKDNLHIIIAAYCHFCDMDTMYAQDDFGKFLCEWFENIKDTTDYEVEGNTGTKQRTNVLTKLSIIDAECAKYMERYGTVVEFDSDDNVNVDALNNDYTFSNPLYVYTDVPEEERNTFNVKAIMISSDYHYGNLDNETLREFELYYNSLSNTDRVEVIENTEFTAQCLNDYLQRALITNNHEFLTQDNILCLLNVVKKALDDDISDDIMINWLKKFVNEYNSESIYAKVRDDQPNYIIGRMTVLYNDLEKYQINKERGE